MPAFPTGNELLRTRNPGIEVFGEALVDQVEIDAGLHEPRIMPTEMIACGRSPDASA
jgi:hypothetical protein